MGNTALVTQAVENGTGGSLGTVQQLLDELAANNTTEINSLSAAGRAHFAEGFEAHGVVIESNYYFSSGRTLCGSLVAQWPTKQGIYYSPASTEAAGIPP